MENKMNFIDSFSNNEIFALLEQAKERVFISLPSIHKNLSEVLMNLRDLPFLFVIIDLSEDRIRDGYGQISAIEELQNAGIKILDFPGNMVSFIIADEIGYFLFPESKTQLNTTKSINAVKMDPVILNSIVGYFFPNLNKKKRINPFKYVAEMNKFIDNAEEEEKIKKIEKINIDKLSVIQQNLNNNPPQKIEFSNILNVYRTKIEFVELIFTGANIQSKTIKISSKILPFKDKKIREMFHTNMSLFTDVEDSDWYKDINDIKDELKEIREDYLIPFTIRKKSFLIKSNHKDFESKVKGLKDKIEKLNEKTAIALSDEILNTKKRIKEELITFFKVYAPEGLEKFDKNDPFYKRAIEDQAESMVNNIKLPKYSEGKINFNLEYFFYDITIEDLKDENFLKILKKAEVITKVDENEIVEIFQANRIN